MKVQLRDYQSDHRGVQGIRSSLKNGRRSILYVLPTGGGKTPISAYIIESAYHKGSTVYFLVHRKELLMQASRHIYALGVPHGRAAPGHSMTKDRVQVASVQTLVNRLDKYAVPDIVIFDEGHHADAKTWRDIKDAWPDAIFIGVTATPSLLSGKGLGVHAGGIYEEMVLGPSAEWLMSNGWLTRAEVYAPGAALDMTGVKMVGGDYSPGEKGKRVDKPSITGSAVEHYRQICPGVPSIAFCASVAHAQHVAEQFRGAGFRSICLDGSMSDDERKKAIDDLGSGKLDVLTSCQIVDEGTDIPVVGCAILLNPTMSLRRHLQQMGRVLRPVWPQGFHPNTATPAERLAAITRSLKPAAIILDHVGNTMRPGLGLPEEDREWTLDGVQKKRKKKDEDDEDQIKVRQCPKCYRVSPPGPSCPNCGHEYETQSREVEEKEGQLRKLTDEEKAAMVLARKSEVKQAKTLVDLVALAKARGYQKGWIARMLGFRRQPVDWKEIERVWGESQAV